MADEYPFTDLPEPGRGDPVCSCSFAFLFCLYLSICFSLIFFLSFSLFFFLLSLSLFLSLSLSLSLFLSSFLVSLSVYLEKGPGQKSGARTGSIGRATRTSPQRHHREEPSPRADGGISKSSVAPRLLTLAGPLVIKEPQMGSGSNHAQPETVLEPRPPPIGKQTVL